MNGALHSFSGSDARVFVHFSGYGQGVTELDSLQTVSWSVYEAKGPARALGHRGVKGYARGVRTIAGSMILTVVGDNPLRPLLNMASRAEAAGIWKHLPGWSVDAGRNGIGSGRGNSGNYWGDVNALRDIGLRSKLATLLPPFNLSVLYSNEYLEHKPDSADAVLPVLAWRLSNVEFITEGIVTSINDTVTEVTAQFVATAAYPLTLNILNLADSLAQDLPAQSPYQANDHDIRDALQNQSRLVPDTSSFLPSKTVNRQFA